MKDMSYKYSNVRYTYTDTMNKANITIIKRAIKL